MTADDLVGCYHRLNRYEFKLALGVSDGQGIWHAFVHGVAKSLT